MGAALFLPWSRTETKGCRWKSGRVLGCGSMSAVHWCQWSVKHDDGSTLRCANTSASKQEAACGCVNRCMALDVAQTSAASSPSGGVQMCSKKTLHDESASRMYSR